VPKEDWNPNASWTNCVVSASKQITAYSETRAPASGLLRLFDKLVAFITLLLPFGALIAQQSACLASGEDKLFEKEKT